jgi:hypothetical protein
MERWIGLLEQMCRGWAGSVGLKDVYRVDTAGGNPGREEVEEKAYPFV